MSEIINLNKHRKATAKVGKEKTASQNRVKFGQTKEQKQKEKLRKEKAEKLLKGHKLDEDNEN